MDNSMRAGLLDLFKRLDDDEGIQIDGLDKKVRKKLRHLFQALKFVETESKSWRRPKKVKVRKILKELMKDVTEPVEEPEPKKPCREASPVQSITPQPPLRTVKGPMRPAPEDFAAAIEGEESDEDGPKPSRNDCDVYADRRVDLEELGAKQHREEWMLDPGDKLRGAFEDINKDKFAVKRTKEEEAAFEKMFEARGASLLDEVQSGKFNPADLKAARSTYDPSSSELWGLNALDQNRAGIQSSARRAFDPDKDMQIRRSLPQEGFQDLLNEAKSMNDRFRRSEIVTSFL